MRSSLSKQSKFKKFDDVYFTESIHASYVKFLSKANLDDSYIVINL